MAGEGWGGGGLKPGTAKSNLHSYRGLSFMKEKLLKVLFRGYCMLNKMFLVSG